MKIFPTSEHGDPGSAAPESVGTSAALRYFIGIMAGGCLVPLLYVFFLLHLNKTGNLPPPALSNNICVDEKLKFLRDNRDTLSPTLLITGSSVAWRGVNGALLKNMLPEERPLNVGLCGQKATQTANTTEWLVGHYKHVRTIIMLAVPQDFTQCRGQPSRLFSPADADDYVFGGKKDSLPIGTYFRFFDPVSLQHNARRVADQRSDRIPLDPLVMTPTGDGPLTTSISRPDLGVYALPPYDPTCLSALKTMMESADTQNQRFLVVLLPVKHEWQARYDPDNLRRVQLRHEIERVMTGTHAKFADINDNIELPEVAFTDAVHVRWAYVSIVTSAIGQYLQPPRIAQSATILRN
ncbi:hypothetical protein [Acetobacter fallax]|uniref:SGNH domain-containing protein n=1 Tax=Acetobacter fallax TaxID=1737473 RepID=A0ABX0K836_9PROT|nr:hypothetical protein [Acetobacter fallax]NHO30988.1 hypothetical protein [Acetobacter fallax]NHO34545.1 hypothetical protein [Acetobacter fallax]